MKTLHKRLRVHHKAALLAYLAAGLFSVIGIVMLLRTGAAAHLVAREAESGTVAGAATITSDPAASGGVAVKFGSTSVPGSARKPFIPIGIWNVNDQHLKKTDWIYALRFVLGSDTTMHRFISGFNMEGVSQDGGGNPYTIGDRDGYARGNGGTIRARLTEVKADGTPDFSKVLAEDTFNPVDRFKASLDAYGGSSTQFIYINTNNVRLTAGRMYTMTYQNVHANPGSNYVSTNSPTVREAFAGPNGRNNLDPNATGAIAGLDPREVVEWSTDGGGNWVYGREVGAGYYTGSATDDDGTRLPWYGWQTSASAAPVSNQPYYAYYEHGNYKLHAKGAKRKTTVTQAGGYAPLGSSVGVVTVKNVSTGESAQTTTSLGEGIVYGPLNKPIDVDVGDELEISHTGTVAKQEGDNFISATFGLGSGDWPFTTEGEGKDMAGLFVLPWPFYRE
jgi:hypothetical protein